MDMISDVSGNVLASHAKQIALRCSQVLREGRGVPQNHIMTFHLWCSSNNIVDDSIRLRLFQCTLTGATVKWYIELTQAK